MKTFLSLEEYQDVMGGLADAYTTLYDHPEMDDYNIILNYIDILFNTIYVRVSTNIEGEE